jgi:hypothetical protein
MVTSTYKVDRLEPLHVFIPFFDFDIRLNDVLPSFSAYNSRSSVRCM